MCFFDYQAKGTLGLDIKKYAPNVSGRAYRKVTGYVVLDLCQGGYKSQSTYAVVLYSMQTKIT